MEESTNLIDVYTNVDINVFTLRSGLDLGRREDRGMGGGTVWIVHVTIVRPQKEAGKAVWGATLEDADSSSDWP